MADTSHRSHDLTENGSSTSEDAPVERSKGDEDSGQNRLAADEQSDGLNNSLGEEARVTEQGDEEVRRTHDDAPAEPPSEQPLAPPGEDYSVLTVNQKRLIVTTASLASLFSPMATAIYCRSLDFRHSISGININRSITQFNIKGAQCIEFEAQPHCNHLLGIFPSPLILVCRLTVRRLFRALHLLLWLILLIVKVEGLCIYTASSYSPLPTSD
jgi:hypothetical protein